MEILTSVTQSGKRSAAPFRISEKRGVVTLTRV
jgi:hypothetical protein